MNLNHKIIGKGHPLIIMHGLFGMLDNWKSIGNKLAEDYMVYLVDLPNHGKSPDIETFEYPLVSEHLYHFMDREWIHESYIMGHSMGGKVAMQLALRHPDKVEKLIVVDIGIKTYEENHRHIYEAMRNLDLQTYESRGDIQDVLMASLNDLPVVLFLMKNIARKKDGGFRWKFNLNGLYKDYKHILSSLEYAYAYDKPALFIRGSESNYIADEDWSMILDAFPKAELTTIDNAGHWVHADQPDELIRSVKSFLSEG